MKKNIYICKFWPDRQGGIRSHKQKRGRRGSCCAARHGAETKPWSLRGLHQQAATPSAAIFLPRAIPSSSPWPHIRCQRHVRLLLLLLLLFRLTVFLLISFISRFLVPDSTLPAALPGLGTPTGLGRIWQRPSLLLLYWPFLKLVRHARVKLSWTRWHTG